MQNIDLTGKIGTLEKIIKTIYQEQLFSGTIC